jgi:hypothetical protein
LLETSSPIAPTSRRSSNQSYTLLIKQMIPEFANDELISSYSLTNVTQS